MGISKLSIQVVHICVQTSMCMRTADFCATQWSHCTSYRSSGCNEGLMPAYSPATSLSSSPIQASSSRRQAERRQCRSRAAWICLWAASFDRPSTRPSSCTLSGHASCRLLSPPLWPWTGWSRLLANSWLHASWPPSHMPSLPNRSTWTPSSAHCGCASSSQAEPRTCIRRESRTRGPSRHTFGCQAPWRRAIAVLRDTQSTVAQASPISRRSPSQPFVSFSRT